MGSHKYKLIVIVDNKKSDEKSSRHLPHIESPARTQPADTVANKKNQHVVVAELAAFQTNIKSKKKIIGGNQYKPGRRC